MSRRLVEVAWGESKPRVVPLLLSLVYALVMRLNVDAWREQDQFFVERDPQLAYPAHPSTVSNTHLVLTGCVLPFVLIFGLAAWAHTRVGADAAVVWWTHQSFALANALLVAVGTFNAGKAYVGRLRPNFFAACDYKGYAAALAEFQEVGASSPLYAVYLAATEPGAVGDRAECRAAVSETDEASLSFPSGHAAIAFAGMTRAAAAVVGAGWLAGRQALVSSSSSASVPTSSEAEETETPRGDADEQTEETRNAERRGYLHSAAALPAAYACTSRRPGSWTTSTGPRTSWRARWWASRPPRRATAASPSARRLPRGLDADAFAGRRARTSRSFANSSNRASRRCITYRYSKS